MFALYKTNSDFGGRDVTQSDWAIITRDLDKFEVLEKKLGWTDLDKWPASKRLRPWTDRYSNLFAALLSKD